MAREARLNAQALARRDPGLMSCILSDVDYTAVSIDLASGEPSVTTHYSRDPNYYAATFGMVGKAPYYKNDVLYLDDIYLMTMAASPLFSSLMRQLWDQRWPAGSFADQWLADADVIKGKLKKERAFAKILALGLSYGMGPAKMVTSAYDKGYTLSLTEAKAFHRAYWELFSEVRRFSNALAARVEASGSIVNPFGYRLTPEPFKAFNAFIQSSVSGVIHVLRAKIAAQAPYALMDTVIHDELLYDVPTTMLEQFRKDKELATDSLNEDLAWSIKIRSGFAPGQTWYEAK